MKYSLQLLLFSVLLSYSEFVVSADSVSKRIALVIGNAAYAEKPLVNPVNDATDMADVLGKLGFEVILRTDANLDTMVEATRNFRDRLSNNGIGVFYFSGHGNQHNSRNYLIPVGAKIEGENDFQRQALPADEVLEAMEDNNRNGVNLIFLDACRSNLYGGKRFKSGGASEGLALMGSRLSGSLIAYATAPGEVADDNPKGRNGIYTKHLLAVLREMPQENIFTLLTEVRRRVSQETHGEQIPREENALMTADFCLALGRCGFTPSPITVSRGEQSLPEKTPMASPTGKTEGTSSPIITPPPTSKVSSCSLNLQPGTVCRDELEGGGLGPEMVIIPAGNFMMGSNNGDNDEKPVHQVSLKAFAIGKYEVTFAEYDAFAWATGRGLPEDQGWGRDIRPIINVSWHDAVAYTEWLSQKTGKPYRLPAEAEWEYAARAGIDTDYWWGSTASHEYANYGKDECCDGFVQGKDQWKYTAPVGSFKPNPFGLYDTVGNVWEWCQDVWHEDYKGAPTDGSAWVTGREEDSHVLRGGSWNGNAHNCRAALRVRFGNRLNSDGFRVASSL